MLNRWISLMMHVRASLHCTCGSRRGSGVDHSLNVDILILLYICTQKSVRSYNEKKSLPPPLSHWENPGSDLYFHVFFSFKVWPKQTACDIRTISLCETMILASSALWLVLWIGFVQLKYTDQTNDLLWKFKANYWNCHLHQLMIKNV